MARLTFPDHQQDEEIIGPKAIKLHIFRVTVHKLMTGVDTHPSLIHFDLVCDEIRIC
jgi:hypothetical protein